VSKKRGNPNWGKPEVKTAFVGVTSFDEIVKKLCLAPAQYESSTELKAWVLKNKDQKYVPVDLLRAWDFTVKEES
jgi:hypothetical protein